MIEICVFICGAVVMILEVVGSRLLAPEVGTSIHVWTALIGVILASLSFGYWAGGRVADRQCSMGGLARLVAGAGVAILVCLMASDFSNHFLRSVSLDLRVKAVAGSLVLFALPSCLLGMISPYAARLRLTNVASSGSTIGTLYAISTAGSIIGTFLGGFLLISWLGTRAIFFSLAFTLLLLSCLLGVAARSRRTAGTALVLAAFFLVGKVYSSHHFSLHTKRFIEIETPYASYRIVEILSPESGRKERLLTGSQFTAQAGVDVADPTRVIYPPAKFFTAGCIAHSVTKRLLLLGGAPFVTPMNLLRHIPTLHIDVVEIDQSLVAPARSFFHFVPTPNLRFFFEDARTFVNAGNSMDPYEAVLIDVFGASATPPFHLLTRETFLKTKEFLKPDGWVMMNIVASLSGEGAALLRALVKTASSVYPHVAVFSDSDEVQSQSLQNLFMVASEEVLPRAIGQFTVKEVDLDSPEVILTDNYAPVEQYLKYAQLHLH